MGYGAFLRQLEDYIVPAESERAKHIFQSGYTCLKRILWTYLIVHFLGTAALLKFTHSVHALGWFFDLERGALFISAFLLASRFHVPIAGRILLLFSGFSFIPEGPERFMLSTLLLFAAGQPRYFVVRVVDSETGRGVPLISFKLPNEVVYWTDSAGIIAMDEPSLVGRQVYAEVTGPGYHLTGKTISDPNIMLRVEPGQTKTLQVDRDILAERLYRLTGEGIYRDSLSAGLPIPLQDSFPEAQVMGQDTVSAALYRGRIFWIWGDTIGPSFFNGQVTAATSDPKDDPSIGVRYRYFTANGRVKAMLPLPRKGLVWIEGLFTVTDPGGAERLLATYTRQDGLKFPDECGLALFDDRKEVFEPFSELPCTRDHTSSHPFLHDGYWYLYPFLRVPNQWDSVRDPTRWEKREVRLPANLPANRNRPASVVWNAYRQRFLLLLDIGGDVFYAEAKAPEGPYSPAVKIVWHDHYTFYNVATHPFFNQDGGRIIYFEGTYTDSFSGAKVKTPRYNYNQVMYRLRLDHPGLKRAREP